MGGAIEVYDRSRFFTWTGRGAGEVACRTAEIKALADRYLPEKLTASWRDYAEDAPEEDAYWLTTFREEEPLFTYTPTSTDDHSALDWKLISGMIEAGVENPDQLDRLFRQSALMRDKWDRVGQQTIENALEQERRGDAAPIVSHTPPCRSDTADTDGCGVFENTRAASHESPQPVMVEVPDAALVIGRSARQLRDAPGGRIEWLIPGFAARGWAVLIAGREKTAGKGTLVSYLLSRLERGEPTVFGDVAPGPVTALIYTEEPQDSLAEKLDAFGLEEATVVFHWELAKLSWPQKIAWLIGAALDAGHKIIYVDNISRVGRRQRRRVGRGAGPADRAAVRCGQGARHHAVA